MKYSLFVGAAVALLASGSAMANMDLAKSKNCMTCHSIDTKIVGPAYKDVAKKYFPSFDQTISVTSLLEPVIPSIDSNDVEFSSVDL